MPYYNTSTGSFNNSIYTVRTEYPNTSIPDNESDYGTFMWYQHTTPTHSPLFQIGIEIAPIVINGVLTQQWEVSPAPLSTVIPALTRSVQSHLDTFAQTKNYDSILSACTYATSAIPKFAREGQDAVNARDTTWAACYTLLEAVQAGVATITSESDFLSYLPKLEWSV